MTSANRKLALHAVPGLVFVRGFAFGVLGFVWVFWLGVSVYASFVGA